MLNTRPIKYGTVPMRAIQKQMRTIVAIACLYAPLTSEAQIEDRKQIVAKGAEVEELGTGFSFTEGPVADKKGHVFFTDQPNNKILRWDAKAQTISTFSDHSGRANGMYFDRSGQLIACADEENQIWSFDKNGKKTVILKDYQGKLFNGPNDLWIDSKGGIYFTDPLYARPYWKRDPSMQQEGMYVYYLSPDRQNVSVVAKTLTKPNGIVGTADGKKLYVADIGASKTYVFDIVNPGELNNQQLFAEMGSDGMTIDNKGNVYLTGKGVTVFDNSGARIAHISVPQSWTANVCFGGKKKNLLFMTAGKGVYGLKMNVKGI
ncbi:SMP-30/gluconolactonase/LRE family protein [Dyadobacter tibetensis]|uniref:SMP-30/gluconolactonase/LRE family protein n=1 Tax=Dyadobacter tibetensis TaxID=1211851 RepID=UPI001E329284|nr:SMP-30/gluconolactonase/LRE family protein [Dyadobacter tibetensis]